MADQRALPEHLLGEFFLILSLWQAFVLQLILITILFILFFPPRFGIQTPAIFTALITGRGLRLPRRRHSCPCCLDGSALLEREFLLVQM